MILNRILQKLIRILPNRLSLRTNLIVSAWNGAIDPEMSQLPIYLPLNRRRVALDIGANNGVTTALLARHFERVFAFEPNPQLLDQWRYVASKNVSTFGCAVSDFKGTVSLNIPIVKGRALSGWGSIDKPLLKCAYEIQQVQTDCTTLDYFCLEQKIQLIDFIKVDVEGVEKKIIQGGYHSIRRFRPWLVVECTDDSRADVIQLLSEVDIHPVNSMDFEQKLNPFSAFNIVFRPN